MTEALSLVTLRAQVVALGVQKADFLKNVGKIDEVVSKKLKANDEILSEINTRQHKRSLSPEEEAQRRSLENENCEFYALEHTLIDLCSSTPPENFKFYINTLNSGFNVSFIKASCKVKDIRIAGANFLKLPPESIKVYINGEQYVDDDAFIAWKLHQDVRVTVLPTIAPSSKA